MKDLAGKMGILAEKIFRLQDREHIAGEESLSKSGSAAKVLIFRPENSWMPKGQDKILSDKRTIKGVPAENSCYPNESLSGVSSGQECAGPLFFRPIDHSLPDCGILIDLTGRIMEVDRGFCELLGSERRRLIDTNFLEYIHDAFLNKIDSAKEILEARGRVDVNLLLVGKEGEIPVWCRALAVYNESGVFAYAIFFIKDKGRIKNSGQIIYSQKICSNTAGE